MALTYVPPKPFKRPNLIVPSPQYQVRAAPRRYTRLLVVPSVRGSTQSLCGLGHFSFFAKLSPTNTQLHVRRAQPPGRTPSVERTPHTIAARAVERGPSNRRRSPCPVLRICARLPRGRTRIDQEPQRSCSQMKAWSFGHLSKHRIRTRGPAVLRRTLRGGCSRARTRAAREQEACVRRRLGTTRNPCRQLRLGDLGTTVGPECGCRFGNVR